MKANPLSSYMAVIFLPKKIVDFVILSINFLSGNQNDLKLSRFNFSSKLSTLMVFDLSFGRVFQEQSLSTVKKWRILFSI